ncbi:SURF1 family protein [Rhizobium sp. SSA_523]|uniref:SURF1 family protein n=1 Tax=Rhizobium sp. SSA_523 TaxID=2952477 RepID=UPI0020912E28|nr:SURF1 family protein [Rhizobium sp. SSA_523]MCO5731047.1 SURF1 family protein [Rhizobium sp. SSA_523]WKC24150.1 SURF1 family protein [Rhizobium sp. SSA_523]
MIFEAKGRRRPGKVIAVAVSVLLALVILLSLGTWQVQRLHWKESLVAQIESRRHEPPQDLGVVEQDLARGVDPEYRRVSLRGRFDMQRERHFFATFEGQSGFYIYAPMTLTDGRILLVNRGFVPYDLKEPASRPGQAGEPPAGLSEEVTITGYVRDRLDGKPSWLVPENDPAKNIFYWKDWDLMVSSLGLDKDKTLPFFVDVDASVTNPGGWPKGGVTQFELPNNHLQYALTWYGLAAALLAVTATSYVRWRKETAQRTGGQKPGGQRSAGSPDGSQRSGSPRR